MGPPVSVCRVFHHNITTVTLEHIVAFETIVAFVTPLDALLTS
jgi:hypothetical protein